MTFPTSDTLQASYNFNIPPATVVTGFKVLVSGNQSFEDDQTYLTATLGGVSLPSPSTNFQLPPTDGQVKVINSDPLWGQSSLSAQDLTSLINSGTLTVNLTANADILTQFEVYDVSLELLTIPNPGRNFNYIKTFEQTDGITLTLALDALGILYQEDVYNAPGELTSFYSSILPGSFASSVTVDDREFIAFSNLSAGTDMPRQYDGTNFNRLSQVGPGVPPTIAQATSVADITSVANATGSPLTTDYTGTFTQNIPAGTEVTFSGFTNAINNGTFTVVSCTSTDVIVNNTAGVTEVTNGLVTYVGVLNTIVSITQSSPVSIRRIAIGTGMGTQTGTGSVITFWGQGTTNTPIASALPGIEVGTTVTIVVKNQGSSGGSSGGTYPTSINGTYVVTQVGTARPSNSNSETCPCFAAAWAGAPANWSGYDYSGFGNEAATYQTTLATIMVSQPIPNLGAGDNITIAGTTISGYNGSWNLTGELNGGQMSITNTALASNVATYTYTVTAGSPVGWQADYVWSLGDRIIDPNGYVQVVTTAGTSGGSIPSFNTALNGTTADGSGITAMVWTNYGTPGSATAGGGFQVTVTGCTNGSTAANNPFNVTNAQIVEATATTFTVNVNNADIASGAETGAVAVVNGTLFTFDPGVLLTSPSTGGTIVQQGGLASGTRECVVLFLTEAGLLTQPSPPVEFNLSASAEAVLVSGIPTGPSNVVARVIAFTEAGQQGVPGAYFYYIPEPVTTVSPFNANQKITYTSTVVNNNTQTSATFAFTDDVLLAATEIDIQGANNFNQIELGPSLGVIEYATRLFSWGTKSKITNLLNYSFDGGVAGYVADIPGNTTYTPKLIQSGSAFSPTISYAAALVQQASHGSTTWGETQSIISCTMPGPVTVGNTIVVNQFLFDSNRPSNTYCEDNLGNTYTRVSPYYNNGEDEQYFFVCHITHAGTPTISVYTTSGTYSNTTQAINAAEFSGILEPYVTDGFAPTPGGLQPGSTFTMNPLTTFNANDLLICWALNDTATASAAPSPGWTLISSAPIYYNSGHSNTSNLAFKKVSAIGTYGAIWSTPDASQYNGMGQIMALRLAPTYAYGQTSLVKALSHNVASGNTILVAVEAYDYTGSVSVVDSASNTYTQSGTVTNGKSTLTLWSAIAATLVALTITAAVTGAFSDSYLLMNYAEFNGLKATVTLDGSASNYGSYINSFYPGSVTPTYPVDVVVSCFFNTLLNPTTPSNYTLFGTVSAPGLPSVPTLASAWIQSELGSTYNPAWTGNGTMPCSGLTVAFETLGVTAGGVAGNAGFPAGWTADPTYGTGGSVGPSPLFGSSYIISNGTDSVQSVYGMITQTAYQDYLLVPIIQIQQEYNIRITASCPSGSVSGNLIVDLFSPSTGIQGTQYPGAAVIPLSSMTGNMQIFDTTLLTSIFPTFVPSDLQIRIYGTNLPVGAKIYVDRIEPYLQAQPLLSSGTAFLGSYVNNFEAFDQLSGVLGMGTENQQPIRSAFTLFDQLVGVKTHSMYSTTDNGTTEPDQWTVREISNEVGSPSVNGVSIGEGWAVIADQAGLFLWDGGQPSKISGEIQPTWDAINWKYGYTIWVTNDTAKKRICIGVPIATPNQWMPDFPANPNPTQPNVVLMLSYRELNTAAALMQEGAIRQTFMGTLKAYQLGRKWAAWNIQSPYAAFCDRADTTRQLLFGNGVGNSKIYQQLPNMYSDDGAVINWRYMTYGFVKSDEEEAKQMGFHRFLNTFDTFLVVGAGKLQVKTYPDFPSSPRVAVSTPQTLLNPPPYGDLELPIQRSGFRFFVDCSGDGVVGTWFRLSRICVTLAKEPYSTTRGGNF